MQARGWLTWEAEVGRESVRVRTFLIRETGAATAAGEDLLEQDQSINWYNWSAIKALSGKC